MDSKSVSGFQRGRRGSGGQDFGWLRQVLSGCVLRVRGQYLVVRLLGRIYRVAQTLAEFWNKALNLTDEFCKLRSVFTLPFNSYTLASSAGAHPWAHTFMEPSF